MVREAYRRKSSIWGRLGALLLINAIPLGAIGWLAWAVATGRKSLDDLPPGVGRNGLCAGLCLVLLFLTASFLLPLAHRLVRALQGAGRRSAQLRAEASFGRRLLEWLLWPPRQLLILIFWCLRAALTLLSLALIAALVLFSVRLFRPEFGEAWFEVSRRLAEAESWLRSLGS